MSAHGVAGPRSVLTGTATRGGGRPAAEPTSTPTPEPTPPDAPPDQEAQEAPQRPDRLRFVGAPQLGADQRRRRARFAVIAAGFFVAAVLFGLVGLHVMLAQNQFRLDRLTSQAADQQARYERLRLQVDQLESPQRIVDTAEQKLGMVLPTSVTYLTPSAPLPTSARPNADGSGQAATKGATSPSTTLPAAGTPPDWAWVKPHLAANP